METEQTMKRRNIIGKAQSSQTDIYVGDLNRECPNAKCFIFLNQLALFLSSS